METKSPIRARQIIYSDLDFKFKINPNTGDLSLKKDVESVKQSVVNILLTSQGERPFNPNFGASLRSFLFENFDNITKAAIETVIINSLRNFEPRVKVNSVDVEDLTDNNSLKITLDITILSPEEQVTAVEFLVERLR